MAKKRKIGVELKRYDNWSRRHICWDFPEIDIRCLVFCCSPKKVCPQRDAALRKIRMSKKRYEALKKKWAKDLLHLSGQ